MAKKRTTLPSDFDKQLEAKTPAELIALFDTMELDARTRGAPKRTAIAFPWCPDELTRWLVAQGLDVDALNGYHTTPLTERAGSYRWVDHVKRGCNIAILLELGAKVDGNPAERGTPLQRAVSGGVLDHVRMLVEHGADLQVRDVGNDRNLLEVAVLRTGDGQDAERLAIVEYLVGLTARATGLAGMIGGKPVFGVTDDIRKTVRKLDYDWQRWKAHTAGGETNERLDRWGGTIARLRDLFGVEPVAPVVIHDGRSPITVRAQGWKAQHDELWEFLVPTGGAAATVQGEVVRISGRIADEMYRNGGANWDGGYRAMLSSFPELIQRGNPCEAETVLDALRCATDLADGDYLDEPIDRLRQIAVDWVLRNPDPIPLPPPAYQL